MKQELSSSAVGNQGVLRENDKSVWTTMRSFKKLSQGSRVHVWSHVHVCSRVHVCARVVMCVFTGHGIATLYRVNAWENTINTSVTDT